MGFFSLLFFALAMRLDNVKLPRLHYICTGKSYIFWAPKNGKILSLMAKDQYVMNQAFSLDVLYLKLSKQCSQNVADGITVT